MELNWRAVVLTLLVMPLITGCEELGLDDGDEPQRKKTQETEVPPSEETEPQTSFPFTRFLYFTGQDFTSPPAQPTFVYSYEIESNSTVRQSTGQSAVGFSMDIPLGNNRFTQSYVLIEENGDYFKGLPSAGSLRQLGTISNGDRTVCQQQFTADGLGFDNLDFLLHAAGTDDTCDTADDLFRQIGLDASITQTPTSLDEALFNAVPLQDDGFNILGYLQAKDADSIRVLSTSLTELYSFDGLGSNDFSVSRLNKEGDLLVNLDGTLYTGNADSVINGDTAATTPLTTISSTSLVNQDWELDGTKLFLRDGNTVRRIDLETGANDSFSTSGFGTLEGRLVQTENYLLVRYNDGTLRRINKTDGTVSAAIAGDALNSYATIGNLLYFSTWDGTDANAYIADLEQAALDCSAPVTCNDASGPVDCPVADAATGCLVFEESQWLLVRENLDRGVETYPALLFSSSADDFGGITYFSNSALFGFDGDTGNLLVDLGSLGGQAQVVQIGVAEQNHALLALELDPTNNANPDGQYKEIYYFNTRRSRSLKNISISGQIDESLIVTTELD